MIGKYGFLWTSLYSDDLIAKLAKQEWSKELGSLSYSAIKFGLDKCLTEFPKYPPTAGQFKQLCEPNLTELGLPTVEDAWAQICKEGARYSHGVILAARNDAQCDVFNWKLLPLQKGLQLFKPIYSRYIERLLDGEQFDLPAMIENKLDKPATWAERKQFAEDHLSALKALVK
jgi:hypothetical protein